MTVVCKFQADINTRIGYNARLELTSVRVRLDWRSTSKLISRTLIVGWGGKLLGTFEEWGLVNTRHAWLIIPVPHLVNCWIDHFLRFSVPLRNGDTQHTCHTLSIIPVPHLVLTGG